MATLQVLGKPSSINVRKVLWTCDEIGLAPQVTPWGSGDLDTRAPEFLALNPNGLVPVLVDGDRVLWESNTICRYLAAQHGRTDLLPAAAGERAAVEQWMDWQATELNTAWRPAFMARVRQAPGIDAAAVDASVQRWNALMQLLDRRLAATGAFAAGPRFTLADVVLGLSTQRWRMTPMARPELPALDAYFARLCERPAFLRHGHNGLP
ncbi:glutathione S-transferase family protein [Ideonella sp. A 288]|uniref:glutathione S-transferase family protein n=1 Tax=Ideonella sp. A 288 TaxID=1962181 RepID=UPI000B4A6FA7|nr:glutathione S-transferase [Ideonella sp. A 288]